MDLLSDYLVKNRKTTRLSLLNSLGFEPQAIKKLQVLLNFYEFQNIVIVTQIAVNHNLTYSYFNL